MVAKEIAKSADASPENISEESGRMDILWYYQFEMKLMLEKAGFKNIDYVNRMLNAGEYMTFICSA